MIEIKLKDALEIGKDCELETVGEAIYNIRLHALNIFNYGEEQKEFYELISEYRGLGLSENESIEDVLIKINKEVGN